MKNEDLERVKAIAEDLYDVLNGDYVKSTDDDGMNYEVKEDENGERYADIDGIIYREGDDEHDLDDLEPFTIWDYINDAYDIEYTVDCNKQYKAVRIMVACGGPNICINTRTGDVELYWWTETARYPMDRSVIDAIDEYFEEYYNCI